MKTSNKKRGARCTADATYHALEALLADTPEMTADDLWNDAQSFFGAQKVNEKTGTQLWRIFFTARSEFPALHFPKKITGDLSVTDLQDIAAGKAVAVIGSNLHAVAVIGARKSFFGWWQIRIQDNRGHAPKWFALWRYRTAALEVGVIRFDRDVVA